MGERSRALDSGRVIMFLVVVVGVTVSGGGVRSCGRPTVDGGGGGEGTGGVVTSVGVSGVVVSAGGNAAGGAGVGVVGAGVGVTVGIGVAGGVVAGVALAVGVEATFGTEGSGVAGGVVVRGGLTGSSALVTVLPGSLGSGRSRLALLGALEVSLTGASFSASFGASFASLGASFAVAFAGEAATFAGASSAPLLSLPSRANGTTSEVGAGEFSSDGEYLDRGGLGGNFDLRFGSGGSPSECSESAVGSAGGGAGGGFVVCATGRRVGVVIFGEVLATPAGA